ICAWDTASGAAEGVTGPSGSSGHGTLITGLASTSDGAGGRLYSIGWDDRLRATNVPSRTYADLAAPLAAQPRGLAATRGGVVAVATAKEGAEPVELFRNGVRIGGVTPPPEGKKAVAVTVTAIAAAAADSTHGRVALATDDARITLCESTSVLNTLTPAAVLPPARRAGAATALAFTPDGSLLAAGDANGRIVVYDTTLGEEKEDRVVTSRWTAHTARVCALAWDASGRFLASGSVDASVFVWSLDRQGDSTTS
ncbi:hypothetical protein KEM52_004621, partial [Ascosphaera acerosa]